MAVNCVTGREQTHTHCWNENWRHTQRNQFTSITTRQIKSISDVFHLDRARHDTHNAKWEKKKITDDWIRMVVNEVNTCVSRQPSRYTFTLELDYLLLDRRPRRRPFILILRKYVRKIRDAHLPSKWIDISACSMVNRLVCDWNWNELLIKSIPISFNKFLLSIRMHLVCLWLQNRIVWWLRNGVLAVIEQTFWRRCRHN